MAYLIYKSDGTVLLTLADGEIDSASTGLDLVGKNVNNYGQYVNNNFIKLLTNFASSAEPDRPHQIGELWYDTSQKKLKVFNGLEYDPTYGATMSDTQPVTTSTGDLWYDTRDNILKIWDGDNTKYWLVGGTIPARYGKFGVEPPPNDILDNVFDEKENVSVVYSYTTPTALVTTSSFQMKPADSSIYFGVASTSTIVKGVTVIDDLDVRGNLTVQGTHTLDKNLTSYYNVTGSEVDLNATIAAQLTKLYPISTSTFNTVAYSSGTEARVVCNTAGTPSYRRFYIEFTDSLGSRWVPDTRYYYSAGATTTATNVIP